MKRRYLCLLLAFCILLFSAGCSQENYELKEKNYYLDLAKNLDSAFPELTFENAQQLDSGTLYLMFVFFVEKQNLYNSGNDFKNGNIYEIPLTAIESVLKEYLNVISFDGSALNYPNLLYNETTKRVVTEELGAFGGVRNARIDLLEYLGGNKVKFAVTFLDEEDNPLQSKEYQILQANGAESYTLLSIIDR